MFKTPARVGLGKSGLDSLPMSSTIVQLLREEAMRAGEASAAAKAREKVRWASVIAWPPI